MKAQLRKLLPAILSVCALIATATIRYVDLNCTNATPPCTNWPTAATNIQDAVDASTDGDEVVVTNGVYASGGRAVHGTMTNRVVIDRALLVRSVNGPLVTFIEGGAAPGVTNGDGAIRCVYVGTNAVLSGFTLSNGHTRTAGDIERERSGGGAWCETLAVVTNCTLIGNSATVYGGGACGGTLNNCILTGNSARRYGGGEYGGRLNNCICVVREQHRRPIWRDNVFGHNCDQCGAVFLPGRRSALG